MKYPCYRLILPLCLLFCACSPGYVVRAAWEEAGILWRRQDIPRMLERPEVDEKLKDKFRLVLAAREFAQSVGLDPEGSYTKYSEINRDVLLWVLNAAEQTALKPVTWWFPIAGNVPYKGFFEKEDAQSEALQLQAKGYDTFVRPSPAMSTLGWFDDPLLSTIARYDDVMLADTVIHEVLHSTMWVKSQVEFNESLANFIGARGSRQFFRQRSDTAQAELAERRWHDERIFGEFLAETAEALEQYYAQHQGQPKEAVLSGRKEIYDAAAKRWQEKVKELQVGYYAKLGAELNNALIIASRIYLTKLPLFERAFALCTEDLAKFIQEMKKITEAANSRRKKPFDLLQEAVQQPGYCQGEQQ